MDYFKIMVTGNDEGIIWDISKEIEIKSNHIVFKHLSNEIDFLKWKIQYLDLYKKWLIDEDDSVYDINNLININMINALIVTNMKMVDYKLYYWFDVDRDKYPDYIWEKCPLSKLDLIILPNEFHKNNRKISPEFPLIFPDTFS